MKLFPQDLGEKRGLEVSLRRVGQRMTSDDDLAQIGAWGRYWLGAKKKQPLPSEALPVLKAVRWPARAFSLIGLLSAMTGTGMLMGVSANPADAVPLILGAGSACWVSGWCCTRPRALVAQRFQRLREKPLSAAEVAALLPQAGDALERSYLTLVMDVIREEVAGQIVPGAGADLREALKALGDAITRLPATRVVSGDSPDIMTEVLRRTAERTLLSAQAEPDRVVAASLIRRVEALHRRADATARTDVLMRRFSALRQEMAAETEALRAGLSAYYTGAHDVADMTRLAEDVQRVAAEAAAITSAAEEVDASLPNTAVRTYTSPVAEAWAHLGPG